MFISSYWVRTRLYIIYSILIDVSLFILFFINNKLSNSGNNIILFNIFFLIVWVLISYIIGRYHKIYLEIIDPIKQIFFSIINFFVFFSLTYFFYYKLLAISFGNGFSQNFLIFIKYIFASFIIQNFFHRIFKNKFNFCQEWQILGSNEFFLRCSELIKNCKVKLIFANLEELISDSKSKRNIIVEDLSNYPYSYQQKIINLSFKGSNIVSIINWSELILQRIPLTFLSSDELINLFSNVYNDKSFQVRLKRIADIALSILIIFFSFPFIVIFSILIYFEDFGPVLYFQKRVGKNGETFTICKLRTMKTNAESKGVQWSRKGDKRVTNIRKFLRSTRIDELPQLFSVLIGDMSLIGPRPERPEIDLKLKEKIPFYELRYLVKPGLSGWAQVNFPYGSSIKDSESKLTYDFFYIKNFSFWLDLLIFFKTIRLVSRREGSFPIK